MLVLGLGLVTQVLGLNLGFGAQVLVNITATKFLEQGETN